MDFHLRASSSEKLLTIVIVYVAFFPFSRSVHWLRRLNAPTSGYKLRAWITNLRA